jgi:uncharacterized membrane protein
VSPPSRDRDPFQQAAARVGFFASLLAVFLCGWFAMRTDDWKRVVGLSALAVLAGFVASRFSRRAR